MQPQSRAHNEEKQTLASWHKNKQVMGFAFSYISRYYSGE
jgi:hypothetical protein